MDVQYNIFFDLDGTIIDSRRGVINSMRKCIEIVIPNSSLLNCPEFEQKVTDNIGPPLPEIFSNLLSNLDTATIIKLVSEYRRIYAKDEYKNFSLYDGIEQVIEYCHEHRIDKGYRAYVATAKEQNEARKVVDAASMTKYFEAVCGPSLDGTNAQKTDLLAHIIHKYNLKPEFSIMIGDRSSDIRAGRNNGMKAIGLTYGFGKPDEIFSSEPDLVCASPLEIIQAIETLCQ